MNFSKTCVSHIFLYLILKMENFYEENVEKKIQLLQKRKLLSKWKHIELRGGYPAYNMADEDGEITPEEDLLQRHKRERKELQGNSACICVTAIVNYMCM